MYLHKISVIGFGLLLSCSAQEKPKPRRISTKVVNDSKTEGADATKNAPVKTVVDPKQDVTEIDPNSGNPPPAPDNPAPDPVPPVIDIKAQPIVSGLASVDKCTNITSNPPDCSAFCTVVVCGEEAGAYDGDLDGNQPIFRFNKKGDAYCGGTGKTVTVEVACHRAKQSQTFSFTNPGAPPSGGADRGSPYRYEKNFYGEKGILWKSAGDGGRPLVIILSRDFRNDVP